MWRITTLALKNHAENASNHKCLDIMDTSDKIANQKNFASINEKNVFKKRRIDLQEEQKRKVIAFHRAFHAADYFFAHSMLQTSFFENPNTGDLIRVTLIPLHVHRNSFQKRKLKRHGIGYSNSMPSAYDPYATFKNLQRND